MLSMLYLKKLSMRCTITSGTIMLIISHFKTTAENNIMMYDGKHFVNIVIKLLLKILYKFDNRFDKNTVNRVKKCKAFFYMRFTSDIFQFIQNTRGLKLVK